MLLPLSIPLRSPVESRAGAPLGNRTWAVEALPRGSSASALRLRPRSR